MKKRKKKKRGLKWNKLEGEGAHHVGKLTTQKVVPDAKKKKSKNFCKLKTKFYDD